jgi:hypothetical protein
MVISPSDEEAVRIIAIYSLILIKGWWNAAQAEEP